jgi:hypothetical protein
MLLKFSCLIVGFICGFFLINWVPIQQPFVIEEYISDYLFSPLEFFVIMICFLIGFLANSILIRSVVEESFQLIRGRRVNLVNLLISYSVMISFYFLFQLGFWQTLVLLCFSIIYGIISIDISKSNEIHDRNR